MYWILGACCPAIPMCVAMCKMMFFCNVSWIVVFQRLSYVRFETPESALGLPKLHYFTWVLNTFHLINIYSVTSIRRSHTKLCVLRARGKFINGAKPLPNPLPLLGLRACTVYPQPHTWLLIRLLPGTKRSKKSPSSLPLYVGIWRVLVERVTISSPSRGR